MSKLRFTNKAVEDLTLIWYYTLETWSEKQADKYYNELISYCEEVARNPQMGKQYYEITEGILGLRANRHIIFYRKVEDENVEIIRIMHAQMDLKNRMKE